MGIFPAAIEVQHRVYEPDGGTDARGNPTGALADPVPRQVIGFYRPDTTDPITVEYMARTIAELMMFVYNPTDYNKLDQVLVFDGAQLLAYQVQSQPISWATGYPWRRYAGLLGGEVLIRRVEEMAGDWDVEILMKTVPEGIHKLAHEPHLVAALVEIAAQTAAIANSSHSGGSDITINRARGSKRHRLESKSGTSDFGVIVQNWPNTKKARAFALPINSGGIHLELTQHLLVKAAAGNTNKQITKKASNPALQMGSKSGESAAAVGAGGALTPIPVSDI